MPLSYPQSLPSSVFFTLDKFHCGNPHFKQTLSLSLVTGRWFNNLPPSNPSRYNIGRIHRFSCCINPETILIGFHEHLQINLNLPTDVCLIALITRKSRLSFYECELVDQATV